MDVYRLMEQGELYDGKLSPKVLRAAGSEIPPVESLSFREVEPFYKKLQRALAQKAL